MAGLTAFQASAFQNNAFQIEGGSSGPPPGSGSSSQRRFPDLGNGFVGDAAPARRKPVRPIWDRVNDVVRVATPPPAAPKPAALAMPPASLFSAPRPALKTPPTFNQFVPPNLTEQSRQMHDTRDASDAMAAIAALVSRHTQDMQDEADARAAIAALMGNKPPLH